MAMALNQKEFAAALFDPSAMPAGLTTARGAADPARFAIYRNNVTVALIKPLEARFPVVRRLVGDSFFRDMARAFLQARKPASPLITGWGDDLPAFIRGYAPAGTVPYLADVAELEAAWTRAYHAADVKPVGLAELGAMQVETLLASSLVPHPAAALIVSPFPVGSIWAAHQTEMVQAVGHAETETVLIVRPAFDVSVHVLPVADAGFAKALMDGMAIGEAAETAFQTNPGFDFGAALTGLVSLGAFAAIISTETNL